MDSDKRIRINWGNVNVPTILAITGVFVTLIGTYFRLDNRVSNIEVSRLQRSVEINKVIEQISARTIAVDNLAYRMTVVEQGVSDVNRRADRINEAVSARLDKLQDSISTLTTKVEVLDQRLQSSLPPINGTPQQLRNN